ncbi:MAG: hypothetical protein AABW79_04630 [Nanoarchaeota archaeon]
MSKFSRSAKVGISGLLLGGAVSLQGCGEIIAGLLISEAINGQTRALNQNAAQMANTPQGNVPASNYNQNYPVGVPSQASFVCNSVSDENRNNLFDKWEISGEKNSFSAHENVNLGLNVSGRQGQNLIVRIFDVSTFNNVDSTRIGSVITNPSAFVYTLESGKLGKGKYKAEWYADNREICSSVFSIN